MGKLGLTHSIKLTVGENVFEENAFIDSDGDICTQENKLPLCGSKKVEPIDNSESFYVTEFSDIVQAGYKIEIKPINN